MVEKLQNVLPEIVAISFFFFEQAIFFSLWRFLEYIGIG